MHQPAPVYSLADEQRARADAAAWAWFTAAADDSEFYAGWLALLAARIDRARGALLLTRAEAGASFGVAAVWPDARRDLQYLGAVAQRVLERREGVVQAPDGGDAPPADGAAHVGYPIEVAGELQGAVVLDIGPGAAAALQDALRQLHWASAWLVDHFRQRVLARRDAELARSTLLNEAMATAMQHTRLEPSALAVANELAARLACERVSVGFERAGQVVPLAMSNTAHFDRRSDLVRWVGEAMDALRRHRVLRPRRRDAGRAARARVFRRRAGAGRVRGSVRPDHRRAAGQHQRQAADRGRRPGHPQRGAEQRRRRRDRGQPGPRLGVL